VAPRPSARPSGCGGDLPLLRRPPTWRSPSSVPRGDLLLLLSAAVAPAIAELAAAPCLRVVLPYRPANCRTEASKYARNRPAYGGCQRIEDWKSTGIRFTRPKRSLWLPPSGLQGIARADVARSRRRAVSLTSQEICYVLYLAGTESLHQFDLFRAIPCRNGFTSLLEDKYSLLCRIGKMYPGR
jgi:hypothetical protein